MQPNIVFIGIYIHTSRQKASPRQQLDTVHCGIVESLQKDIFSRLGINNLRCAQQQCKNMSLLKKWNGESIATKKAKNALNEEF